MSRNPHRIGWRKTAAAKVYTCAACGAEAKTARDMTSHADLFEVVATRGPR